MSLEKTFNKAAQYLQSLASELNSTELLRFYALYKQATIGPCNISKPNWYQMQAKQKWEAWESLNDMSCDDAMNNYIQELTKLNPNWKENAQSESSNWVGISQLVNMEDEISDTDKTFLDWVKEGHIEKVQELLDKEPKLANLTDSEGLLPIHWAADRGHLRIIEQLIKKGTNVNSQDEDGQTPLHYAASCGHLDVVKYLLSIGAQSIEDKNGMQPKDIADEHLRGIL
ncbi:Acyl-CoA-binding domain-containing protein 6 [Eufriesea mexicana]|uniref:acyl-CoA-binding domain-containing protein 6-like n=1 Tax=Eufriesea mexicana TaxID=516756 RepID=UPI00083BC78E|nr:PREDICTED: acyl-CoA-binding domain-containing protein 6-like [Eufriesea mexicana]XP_017765758.1 PREDICTED: acyl-CoA-binding domain-containing protein 6-like [Eufriesea mexicana]OAD61674.1 Acyl-CoA-binding domain-containing protein 6 [Eufriesea mexicana]